MPFSKSGGLVLNTFPKLDMSHIYQQLLILTKGCLNITGWWFGARPFFKGQRETCGKELHTRQCTLTTFWSQGKPKRSTSVTWTRCTSGGQRLKEMQMQVPGRGV